MAVLETRVDSLSDGYQQSRSGWNFCMSRAYCKWPAIAGIVVLVLVICLTLFCCIRCCTRRRRHSGGKSGNTSSMFHQAPYQGYQHANNAPPPYGEPPRFAQFDAPSGKKITEDSLPAMPSWDTAQTRRVEHESEDVEMGHLEKPLMGHQPSYHSGSNASRTEHLHPETESHAVAHKDQTSPHYTGPAFENDVGTAYTGPHFGVGHEQETAYSSYTPSESTRYEPSRVNEPQDIGTTYGNSPQGYGSGAPGPPSILQAGRRPAGNGANAFRDI